mmetsp:Transcript_25222/g.40376  ORF Transcript_25222/g.40376 Transcript_25222/m.40376 type:complete len:674 (+) Transcript_25222:59-2080(+)
MESLRSDLTSAGTWHAQAGAIAPSIWGLLLEAGHGSATLLSSLDDLDEGDLNEYLSDILQHTSCAQEYQEFADLVLASACHSNRKRKAVFAALDDPGLRVTAIGQEVVTERQRLVAAASIRLASTAGVFPVANHRPIKDKDDARRILAERLAKILGDNLFPSAATMAASIHPERLLSRMAAGKRTSTLKEKLRLYKNMSAWMWSVFHVTFPVIPIQLMDYLAERGEEPCGHTVPTAILSMIGFLETVGGIPSAKCLATHPTVKAMADDLRLELLANSPRPVTKASCLAVAFLLAWESKVADESEVFYVRILAWVKLVRVWAALRSSDLLGISPRDIVMKNGNLRGMITQSKTTGKGKKVGVLFFHVSGNAWLRNSEWLSQGWILFQESATDRTCLLPLPSKDLAALSDKIPSYTQSCAASRKLMAVSALQATKVGEEAGEELPLLLDGVQVFWTEHSDRATLPTWAAMIGVSKEDADRLGRWQPSESEAYVRAARTVVLRVQDRVAVRIRTAGKNDLTGEEELLEKLEEFLTRRGMPDEMIAEQLRRLRFHRTSEILIGVSPPEEQICEDVEQVLVEMEGAVPGTAEELPLSHGALFVSLSRAGRPQTVHKVGSCWRRPGVDYKHYVALDEGELQSPSSQFSKVCSECFPKGLEELNISSSEDDSSNSSSDSS